MPLIDSPQQVFTINDIVTSIPPTNIVIRKEDLTYDWRTLRTSVSTKIASGQGQVMVSVVIPFLDGQILELHRLLVELKQSPYCYVENRFIRESIVPEWNINQFMAFTVTNIVVAPIPQTSDAWVLTLEMLWFNYFPYVPNYLFKEDWETKWIDSNLDESDVAEKELLKRYTIGWDFYPTTGARTARVVVTDQTDVEQAIPEWSNVVNDYVKKPNRTIEDMLLQHDGQVFDLAPIPGNMEPSKFVSEPINSRIYVRYINYLQRDALWEGFGIDVEKDLRDYDIKHSIPISTGDKFFRIYTDKEKKLRVASLASKEVPSEVRAKWLERILGTTDFVEFHYSRYRTLQLPDEWNKKVIDYRMNLTQFLGGYGDVDPVNEFVVRVKNEVVWREKYRLGYRNPKNGDEVAADGRPVGKHVPIGKDINEFLALTKDIRTKGDRHPHVISESEALARMAINSVHNDPKGTKRMSNPNLDISNGIHYGHDFSGRALGDPKAPYVTEPIYAVADGIVISIHEKPDSPTTNWKWLNLVTGHRGSVDFSSNDSNATELLNLLKDETLVFTKENGGIIPYNLDFGFYIFAKSDFQKVYYRDFGSNGIQIVIGHPEASGGTSYARYLHLSQIEADLQEGKEVKSGQPLGKSGGTGFFGREYLQRKFLSIPTSNIYGFLGTEYDAYISSTGNVIGKYGDQSPHLHFEYWEAVQTEPDNAIPASNSPENTENPATNADLRQGIAAPDPYNSRSHLVVDVIPSYEASTNKSGSTIDVFASEAGLTEKVLQRVNVAKENGWLSELDATALAALYTQLIDNGWAPFDDLTNVSNVWVKHIAHAISIKKDGEYSANHQFDSDSAVVTAVQGSMRHIVASLPILSHEFPTHQHLGSIEPAYTLQFAINDDNLIKQDGISEPARQLEIMRSALQANSRSFRVIPDAYACSLNTFITRLMGSYKEWDLVEATKTLTQTTRIMKRMNISRSETHTVQGQPGLSMLTMELQETNPYEMQTLVSTAAKTTDIEAAYSEILNALYTLNLSIDSTFLPILLAQQAHVNLDGGDTKIPLNYVDWMSKYTRPISTGFESTVNRTSALDIYDVAADGSDYKIAVPDSDGSLIALIRELGIDTVKGQEGAIGIATAERIGRAYTSDISSVLGITNPPVVITGAVLAQAFTNALGKTVTAQELIKDGYLDISEIYAKYPDDIRINATKLYEYRRALLAIMTSAEVLLAEREKGGFNSEYLSENLYKLPIKSNMWLVFQAAFEALIKRFVDSYINKIDTGFAVLPFTDVTFTSDPDILKRNKEYFNKSYSYLSPSIFSYIERGIDTFYAWYIGWSAGSVGIDDLMNQLTTDIHATVSSEVSGADIARNEILGLRDNFIYSLVAGLPVSIFVTELGLSYSDWLKNFLGDNWIDYVNSGMESNFRLREYFREFLDSCNLLVVGTLFGWAEGPGILRDGFDLVDNGDGTYSFDQKFVNTTPGSVFGQIGDLLPGIRQTIRIADYFGAKYSINKVGSFFDSVLSFVELGPPSNSPLNFIVDTQAETAKINYLKNLLSNLARQCLGDANLLTALKLQKLAGLDLQNDYKGQEAYPDLKLPFHPYYGNTYNVAPDFYMWSLYDDAGFNSSEYRRQIAEQAGAVIERCHKTLTRQPYIAEISPKNVSQIEETDLGTIQDFKLRYGAEGSPDTGTGPMGSPYAMPEAAKAAEAAFYKELGDEDTNGLLRVRDLSPFELRTKTGGDSAFKDSTIPDGATVPYSSQDHYYHYKLGTTDGSVLYPARTSVNNYTKLFNAIDKKIASNEAMFGSRAGYLGDYLEYEDSWIPGMSGVKNIDNKLSVKQSFVHAFDVASLQDLAVEASADIVSQKATMRRAYPTFKLYFVEEDEFETRFFNFDDFHSFNGVKDFSVTMDKTLAADVAVVTLQNISGTLDGTARNIITDADYFDRNKGKQLDLGSNTNVTISGEARAADTVADQPFGAVVLRPGLNVQLRAGFTNDPTSLEVLISGRIVDLAWNKASDMAEITIQSFGTELENITKGAYDNQRTFYATHQILGAMMLEPELYHFGRWEFGKTFQVGENQNSQLDFVEYARESFSGRFGITSWFARQIWKHPYVYAGLNIGLGLSNFIPSKILTGVAGKVASLVTWLPKFVKAIGPADDALLVTGRTLHSWAIATELEGAGKLLVNPASNQVARDLALHEIEELIAARIGAGGALVSRGAYLQDLEAAAAFSGNPALQGQVATYSQDVLTQLWAKVNAFRTSAAAPVTEAQFQSLVDEIVSVERNIALRAFAGRTIGQIARPADVSWFLAAGKVSGLNTLRYGLGGAIANQGKLIASTVVLDTIVQMINYLYAITFKQLTKYYTRVSATLFLDPRDDNLYPPSPKDYMRLNKEGFFTRVVGDLVHLAGRWAFNSETANEYYNALVHPEALFDKKVRPHECRYVLQSTSIWKVFYEMTLRHPGWVYGTRPYGRDFRYTMFFGVPSQRYWSKPASNQFVTRVNRLRNFLADKTVNEAEYLSLYGDNYDGLTRADFVSRISKHFKDHPEDLSSIMTVHQRSSAKRFSDVKIEEAIKSHIAKYMTAKASEEYLRGLELRFVPFRRYHMLTSQRDIIWNGISGSERSVSNAIDVMYYWAGEEEVDPQTSPQNTVVVKANSFIPENMLKIRPIAYPNCRSYGMALRYGMGELIHTMKDMYRGSLIVLGNPRIRPWDVCILSDTYSDLIGPIEVQQVVHNFSFETGFITEIRPGAIVIGNEVASWPMIEGMKLWSMAMQDAEANGADLPGTPGLLGDFADYVNTFGSKEFSTYVREKGIANGLANTTPEAMYKGLRDGKITPPDVGFFEGDITYNFLKGIDNSLGLTSNLEAVNSAAGAGALGGALGYQLGGVRGAGIGASSGIAYGGTPSAIATTKLIQGVFYNYYNSPSLAWLIGGAVLFAKCLREEAVIIVPLMKAGKPVVAGMTYTDPATLWSNFKGDIKLWIDDAISGSRDLIEEWDQFGHAIWRTAKATNFGASDRIVSDKAGTDTLGPAYTGGY